MAHTNTPQLLTKEVGFAEGPLWHPDGFLLFSDQVENCIKKITPEGELSVYIQKSGCDIPAPFSRSDSTGSNGLDWYNGKLVMCRHGSHSIALYENGKYTTLADSYDNKPLNSPNDLIVSKDGTIYFTDPPYGLEGQKLLPEYRIPFAGVYSYKDGVVTLLYNGLKYPNGVCFSNDEKILYVSSASDDDGGIFKTKLTAQAPYEFELFTNTPADGILNDEAGNIYTASGDYIYKFNSSGEKTDAFFIGTNTSNLNWGGKDNNDLYITCYDSVWVIKDIR